MEKRIVFNGIRDVELAEFDLPKIEPGKIIVRNCMSMISSGTEMIVFNRSFKKDSHWDKWVKYPFYPGYAAVGIVETAGTETALFKPGDRVVHRASHASAMVINERQCFPVPENILNEEAVWFALAKIAAMGAIKTGVGLGDAVAVIGAGPVGQMAIRWMVAAGAEKVIVIDAAGERLEHAGKGGATHLIRKTAEGALDELAGITDGKLADIVIDTTGIAAVFPDTLRCARKYGRVVLLGDSGYPEQQHLTSDVVLKGLTITGAHDPHETPDWNSEKIIRLLFSLVERDRFNLKGLNTHLFKPEECKEAYDILNRERASTLGVLFNWER